jgi:hypothetical protein
VGRRNFQTPWTIGSLFRIVGPVGLGAPTSVPNTSTPGRVVEAVPSSRTWEANRQMSTTNGYLERFAAMAGTAENGEANRLGVEDGEYRRENQ